VHAYLVLFQCIKFRDLPIINTKNIKISLKKTKVIIMTIVIFDNLIYVYKILY